jgi:hypothetical protein
MKTTIIKTAIAAMALTVMVTACKKDSSPVTQTTTPPAVTGAYSTGVFIVNEGQYPSGAGTVSFFNRSTKALSNDIFQTVNGRPLGDEAQSMTIYSGKGYIVVNNAQCVEVVTAATFKSVATITGFTLPRYLTVVSSTKAYVSDWGTSSAGFIGVVNLSTNTITNKIMTNRSPETMVMSGINMYVANVGGMGTDSTVSVINTQSDQVVATIQVNYNPNSLSIDANGKIWVACAGKGYTGYSSPTDVAGSLVCIDPSSNTIVNTPLTCGNTGFHPSNMVIDGALQNLYYLCNNQVYTVPITASALNTNALINRSFYGLGYDNTTKYLYAANAGDFTDPGWFIRYQTTGAVVDSFQVGVAPGYFCFN